jgi:CspA family cold shock protein
MSERVRGHVERFSHQKRCGFIRPDDGYPDIPVFLSDFRDMADVSRLRTGDAVEFEIEHTPEGPRGVDVVVLDAGATAGRIKGKVKWFSHEKRYGFIRRDDGLRDVFVHMSCFRHSEDAYWVRDGDVVEFGIERAPKGPRAVDVVVLRPG